MKKQLLISALAAFTLYSCGSGTNNNSGEQNADTVAVAPASCESLSNKQIWDLFAKQGNDIMLSDREYENSKTPDGANVQWEGMEMSNYFAYKTFPMKSGGIKIYQTSADFYWHGDGEDRFEFNAYVIQNGALVQTPLESDLQQVIDAMTSSTSADDQRNLFWDNGIFFPKSDILFAWDGEKMVKNKASKVSIAYEVVEKMVEKEFAGFEKNALEHIEQKDIVENLNRIRVYPGDGSMSLHCYPMNGGGYYVPVVWDDFCDCPVNFHYGDYTYKDGNLTKTKSLIPKPSINDFYTNADQIPANVSAILKQRIADHSYYYFTKDSAIMVTFEGFDWDGEYDVPAPLKKYYEKKRSNFPGINYIWNGEKFIRDPEDNLYEEDLSLFEEVSQPSSKPIVLEVVEKLAEQREGGFEPDVLDKLNIEKLNETPQHISYFQPYFGDMGISVFCFPYTSEGYFVLVVWDLVCDDCDGAYEYHPFNYINGSITKTALPNELKSNLKNNHIQCEGNTLKIPQKNLTFNWNGEKFIKQ